MHQEHSESLYECINVLKHQNLRLENQLRESMKVITERKHKVLSCQLALMKDNYQLRAKERFYEGFNREYIKGMDLESVRSMEKRIFAVHELLKTEIAYRERVERIQAQLSDMIYVNNEGKNVLEKALDLLNESHEEECFATMKNFGNKTLSGEGSGSDWENESMSVYATHMNEELPNEIKTLDFINDGIKHAIRESSISHCLDPIR